MNLVQHATLPTLAALTLIGGAAVLALGQQSSAPAPTPAPATTQAPVTGQMPPGSAAPQSPGSRAGGPQPAAPRPPAPTLSRPATPNKSVDAQGFIRRWLLLEPIRVGGQLTDSAVQAAVKTEYFPNQLTVMPRHGDKVTVNGTELTWHAVDTTLYNVNLFHFAYALNQPTSNVLFWAVTVVDSPREMPGVRLAIGSNAASTWWLNGTEVIALYNDRQAVIDDGVSKRLTLKQGSNVIRAAVINAGGATDFCARFLDAEDNPIKGLTVSLGK